MTAEFQFGLVVRGQAEPGEDIARRYNETLNFVRLASKLGYDSVTKTAHYSAHPYQMLQMVPMLARYAAEAPGMRFNAGHALNYANVQPVAALQGVRELHIGHAIVSRSVFVGIREAVREMKRLMREAAAGTSV